MVARDICAAASSCRDFQAAAPGALRLLGEATNHELPTGVDWDQLVQQPTKVALPKLKEAARCCSLKARGTKAELIVRLLKRFGLCEPSHLSARLLWALWFEQHDVHLKSTPLWRMVQSMAAWKVVPAQQALRCRSSDEARATLSQAYPDMQALQAAHDAQSTHQHSQTMPGHRNRCFCGNKASSICSSRSCGRCCRNRACAGRLQRQRRKRSLAAWHRSY
eukprot:jgi/Chrzof1/11489/UNPLg00421.t1